MKRFEEIKILDIRYLIFLVILVFVFSSLVFIPAAKAISPVGEGVLECEKVYGPPCWEECQRQDTTCAYEVLAPCMEENVEEPEKCSYEADECARQSKDCQDKCNSDYDECIDYYYKSSSPDGSLTPSDYATCNNDCSGKGLSAGTTAFDQCISSCLSPELPQYTAPSAPSQPPQNLKSAGSRFGKLGGAAGLSGAKSFEETAGGVIKGALALVGMIFLLLMVYGGYIWMTARGEEEEAKRARNIITMAIIGISVVMAAYAITYFIVARLTTG